MSIFKRLAMGGNYYYLKSGHSKDNSLSRLVIALFVVPLIGLLGVVYAFVGNIYKYMLQYPIVFLIVGLVVSFVVRSSMEKYVMKQFDNTIDYTKDALLFRIYSNLIVIFILIIWVLPALLNVKY